MTHDHSQTATPGTGSQQFGPAWSAFRSAWSKVAEARLSGDADALKAAREACKRAYGALREEKERG
jgi:hypothetical protein